MELIIYCPSCWGQRVKQERIAPHEVVLVSMSDLGAEALTRFDPPRVALLATWAATCEECGFRVEYKSY